MRPILIVCSTLMFTGAAAAQMPSTPNMPSGGSMPTAPSMPGGVDKPTVPGGTAMPDSGQTSNPIDQAKIEAMCKIPANATKPECLKLMLKK